MKMITQQGNVIKFGRNRMLMKQKVNQHLQYISKAIG